MLSDKKETIERLIDKGMTFIEGKIDELKTKISQSKLNAIQRSIHAYNDVDHVDNKEISYKITNDVELILYNKKDMVIQTKKNQMQNNILCC